MDNKEPDNPVVYLSNLVKKLDVKNRNGLVALAIVNLLVIFLFKFYLKGSGLLSWILPAGSIILHFQIALLIWKPS